MQVDTALAGLSDVMNAVENHYLRGGTAFGAAARHNGALTLLYLLGDGLKARSERETRIEQGEIRESDIPEQI